MIELTAEKYRLEDQVETIPYPASNKLILRLAENPTTGYRWEVENLAQDLLEIIADEFEPAIPIEVQQEQGYVGVGGFRILTFSINKELQEVCLRHGRSWLRGKDGDQATSLTIKLV